MTDDDITLPELPAPGFALRELELWGQNQLVDLFDDRQMRAYACAAILLDRQQRAAPSAEPVQTIIALKSDEQASLSPGAYQVRPSAVRPSAEPTDHTVAMRQALEALEERYIGALRDNAIDALRAALGEKRC